VLRGLMMASDLDCGLRGKVERKEPLRVEIVVILLFLVLYCILFEYSTRRQINRICAFA